MPMAHVSTYAVNFLTKPWALMDVCKLSWLQGFRHKQIFPHFSGLQILAQINSNSLGKDMMRILTTLQPFYKIRKGVLIARNIDGKEWSSLL